MKSAALPLLLAALLWPAAACQAQAQRLDDSASPRPRVPAQVVLGDTGRPLLASPFAETAYMRFGRIDYRLATGAYLGRRVRISYVVPALIPGLQSPQGLRVQWRAEPPFASGTGRPGDHVPVWSGVITSPWTNVSLDLDARLDLTQLGPGAGDTFSFECYFEIEVIR